MVSKLQLALGGIWINVFGLDELVASGRKEAACLFFLHGRFGSAERIEHIAQLVYDDAVKLSSQDGRESPATKSLIIVTFDQRNHGTRKISNKAQQSWPEGNIKHAQDMLAMQVGTANDVSFLADFLPSFLFPVGEVEITEWAVTGISLGGHSTWIVLRNDPRFRIGVPMLGCPSYRVLMEHRAGVNGLPYAPPYMPQPLLALLSRSDPDSCDYRSDDKSANPFYGKHILVLSGEKDELVPWSCGKAFVDGLNVGLEGDKRICIEPGRGHETSSFMISELVKWLVEKGLCR